MKAKEEGPPVFSTKSDQVVLLEAVNKTKEVAFERTLEGEKTHFCV